MTPPPRARGVDHTLAFLRAPYTFIGSTCDELDSDVFQTRLFLDDAICLRGEEAAALFYDGDSFQRTGATPSWLERTLLGRGGVQGLDGARHQERKALLLSILGPDSLARARHLFSEEWALAVARWEFEADVVLYDVLGGFARKYVPGHARQVHASCHETTRPPSSPAHVLGGQSPVSA